MTTEENSAGVNTDGWSDQYIGSTKYLITASICQIVRLLEAIRGAKLLSWEFGRKELEFWIASSSLRVRAWSGDELTGFFWWYCEVIQRTTGRESISYWLCNSAKTKDSKMSSSFTRLRSVNPLFYARIKGRLLHWTDEVGRDVASFRTSTEATQIHHLMITLQATHFRPRLAKMRRCKAEVVQMKEPNLAITHERRICCIKWLFMDVGMSVSGKAKRGGIFGESAPLSAKPLSR